MHMQERQNIIFSLTTPVAIPIEQLVEAKDYLQSQIDQYNENTQTQFVLSNVDFEQSVQQKSYAMGALITLILSLLASLGILFVRKELFPNRKLKF